MTRLTYRRRLRAGIAMAAACSVGNAAADDGACATVYAALAKLAITPNHQFMSTHSDFHPGIGSDEVITTREAMYVEIKGQWHARAYNGDEAHRQLEQAARSPTQRCVRLRDETIDGTAAALYQTHKPDADGSRVDTTLWISKDTGLPLRQKIDVDVGGKLGKSHTDVRFDYTDVVAPTMTP